MPKVKRDQELRQTIAYVEKNVVAAHAGRKCVDGRYLPDQATGMLARPGGDCGYVMALLAVSTKKQLGLTPEQCFNAVYKAIAKDDGHFCMHTDHHADPDAHTHKGLIGCGHLAKAATEKVCEDYDVDCHDVERFVAYARNLAEIEPAMDIVNLDGEHEEKGVLVIDSEAYSINADNPQMQRMYFIYDEKRDEAFMKKLVEALEVPGVTFEEMKKESDIQLQATLHNLAKGLPLYNVSFDGDVPRVSLAGKVA